MLHGGAKGPGIFFILPCIEHYTKVDLRTLTFDVPPQEVLTKDSVTVSVDAVVYYRVHNATVSVANVENAHHSTRLLAQTTLRNMLGTHNLHEILSDRESISNSMQVQFKINLVLVFVGWHVSLGFHIYILILILIIFLYCRQFLTSALVLGESKWNEWKCK